jgi:hypothetical protein
MKMKRLWHGLLLLFVTGLFYSGGAMADKAWYRCTIDSVGTRYVWVGTTKVKQYVVQLDDVDSAFTDMEFYFHDMLKKEMLAMVLTAVTNGYQVEVLVNLASTAVPLKIKEMHLITTP